MPQMDQPFYGLIQPKSASQTGEIRKHFVAASGEFVGTFLFLFTAFLGHAMSVQTAPNNATDGMGNSNQTIIFISLSYGFSLLVAAWILYRISGGLFNPAVTVAMMLTGTLPFVRGCVLIPVQILGGICAAAVVGCIIPVDIAIVQTTLAPSMNVAQGLFLEMFLTAELVFTILMLAAEKSKDTFIAPIGIGLCLFVIEFAGVNYTGASVNPARSFGPCVAAASFQGYHWIYWIGPLLGAFVAAGFYHFIKFMNYEDANPGQDSAGGDEPEKQRNSQDVESGSRRSRSNQRGSRDGVNGGQRSNFNGNQDLGGRDVNGGHRSNYNADQDFQNNPPRSRGSGRQVDMDGYGRRI